MAVPPYQIGSRAPGHPGNNPADETSVSDEPTSNLMDLSMPQSEREGDDQRRESRSQATLGGIPTLQFPSDGPAGILHGSDPSATNNESVGSETSAIMDFDPNTTSRSMSPVEPNRDSRPNHSDDSNVDFNLDAGDDYHEFNQLNTDDQAQRIVDIAFQLLVIARLGPDSTSASLSEDASRFVDAAQRVTNAAVGRSGAESTRHRRRRLRWSRGRARHD
ncbi:hypothetical protein CkaCkLH20_12252 [Colletotrichum karsti]|uniref:Uncharacterized protein n=1 Tax=Colletotrichum karsti TaxID=1095194 RepID=A0A9P6HTG2_9PEZI|nr:uncharacterized protein CkaCkLH20_12252 [Colletotrichum karsti]KAF9870288.1 hypothetical protein CkaCkLH20_12252 [Colletotrichum karsti]